MKILFIGDVVGSIGRDAVAQYMPLLKQKYKPTITIINGENSASGRGITQKIYKQFLKLGINAVTLGNHAFDNQDIFEFIEDAKYLVRPANYPDDTTPGTGMIFIKNNQYEIAVINLQGRTFLADLDDPFRKVDSLIEQIKTKTNIIFVDFHAETTSEKEAMGWYLDGRVSAVIGTHTHVQTADERILPQKTAYLTDVGMTGPYDSVLGMKKEQVLRRFLTSFPTRFEVPKAGRAILSACLIKIDEKTGNSTAIERILINEDHPLYL